MIAVTESIAPSKNSTTDPKRDPKNIVWSFRYASKNIPPKIIPTTINPSPGMP